MVVVSGINFEQTEVRIWAAQCFETFVKVLATFTDLLIRKFTMKSLQIPIETGCYLIHFQIWDCQIVQLVSNGSS